MFGPPSSGGLGISVLRIPVGLASDFMLESTPVNYANKRDLSDFSIEKDKEFFIPLLRKAANVQKGKRLRSVAEKLNFS